MANSRSGQVPGPDDSSGEVGDVLKAIQADIQVMVRGEVELAKAELTPSAKNAGMGAGVFGGALYFVLHALILLFIAGSLAIWQWLQVPIAVGFVIMAGVLVVIAGILALIGVARFKKVKGPERTVANAQQTVDGVKGAITRGTAAATGKELPAGTSVEPAKANTPARR